MKISKQQEVHHITLNHLSDIKFKDYMNPYKKMYCKTVIDITLASDNLFCFKKEYFKKNIESNHDN